MRMRQSNKNGGRNSGRVGNKNRRLPFEKTASRGGVQEVLKLRRKKKEVPFEKKKKKKNSTTITIFIEEKETNKTLGRGRG